MLASSWVTPGQRELAGELIHHRRLSQRRMANQAKEITRLGEDRAQLKAALTRITESDCQNPAELARLTLAWLENKP